MAHEGPERQLKMSRKSVSCNINNGASTVKVFTVYTGEWYIKTLARLLSLVYVSLYKVIASEQVPGPDSSAPRFSKTKYRFIAAIFTHTQQMPPHKRETLRDGLREHTDQHNSAHAAPATVHAEPHVGQAWDWELRGWNLEVLF